MKNKSKNAAGQNQFRPKQTSLDSSTPKTPPRPDYDYDYDYDYEEDLREQRKPEGP